MMHAKKLCVPRLQLPVLALLCLLTAACSIATSPDRIAPNYVSPDAYRNYACPDLAKRLVSLGYQIEDLYASLEQRHSRDQWQMAFIWFYGVSGFFIDGDGAEAEEFRRLQGDFEAVRMQAVRQDCGFEAPSRQEIVERARTSLTPADGAPNEGTAAPSANQR